MTPLYQLPQQLMSLQKDQANGVSAAAVCAHQRSVGSECPA